MAAYISFQPSDYFSTLLYSYAASPNAITGAGFAPDAVSLKGISGTSGANNWYIGNTVMGNTKTLRWNDNTGEVTTTDSILSFDSDGYTLGADATANCNSTGTNYVGYNWKAGTTSGISGGTITPSAYSFNTTAAQSVIAFTGTGASATVPHGLGAIPQFIIVKSLSNVSNWIVYHGNNTAAPETDYMVLNENYATGDNDTMWDDTVPTSSVFSLGNNSDVNGSTRTYIAYCFAPKQGYSKFDSFVGSGSTSCTPFIYLGFRPAFLLIKKSSSTGDWMLFDDKRLGYNPDQNSLNTNLSGAQGTTDYVDILSNGFRPTTTDALVNGSGVTYVYAAFAEIPLVSSNDVAGVAR